MTEADAHSLFLCAFWAQVAEKVPSHKHFLNATIMDTCIHATVAWAKVLMAHRTYHCSPSCSTTQHDVEKSYLWNPDLIWEVSNDWYTAGSTLALAYDVLHDRLSESQRRVVRSALALLVMKRWTWGVVDQNTAKYPDAETHPHRIVSNWGMYHSNLYITNLAIEGESGFVPYAQHVLSENDSVGFNHKMNRKFEALINAYMTHSVYPDGSTFEDGYTYHTAFREGSLAFLAAHRRGHNLLNTPRFRNIIHNVAQMFEPWQCAPLLGHSSGGGQGYPAYVGLLRYTYPDGSLPRMLWAQRFGKNFTNDGNCRIWWTQTMTQLVIFGDEHKQDLSLVADAPESLSEDAKKHFPLAYVSTRRGLIIWAQAWQGPSIGTADVLEYRPDGSTYEKKYSFPDAEENNPWNLGWPMEDDASEIGFSRNMTMNGNPDLAAFGMNEWRRHYREQHVEHLIRSVITVKSRNEDIGYGVLVDSVSAGPGTHTFESYLILDDEVKVERKISQCNGNQCKIVLASANGQVLDVHVLALGNEVSFRVEEFNGHKRIVVRSLRETSEEIWIVFFPRSRDPNDFSMVREGDNVKLSTWEGSNTFQVRKSDHTVIER
ncbi:unnamed protein product [Agarophyton chilense]